MFKTVFLVLSYRDEHVWDWAYPTIMLHPMTHSVNELFVS